MGVPKFYRWISERYPCLSTVAREYQLPDFDNLYLDMNGIIHVCSHPNDADAHFRISEEEIFKNIFDYIDFIFRMVKPKKCFFMAVDGVAPRAKMNQQRDRRFRSAKEAEENEKAARRKGEELPTEKRFDSNCISPGTEFMERLHEHLKYFVVQKLSTDPVWQKEGLKIYLSGHNAPGEGEHKAMDFIRYLRSQEGYDPNTRHCIYGQDADLIMLALCTHEPHIALLREEVVFGKKAQKRIQSADKVTFHLLHINLLREYLDHEFSSLKDPGVLKQGYNLENIIDDWLLMCFLVGNDFLPHLPNLHIAHDALPILHKTYTTVMPTLNGYLHERGKLNLKNFEAFMTKLGERDLEMFDKAEEKHPDGMQKMNKNDFDQARKKFPGLDIPDTDSDDEIWEEEFRQHKRHYYMTKMGYDEVSDEVLREQAEGYIRAVQWNLHYYYNGVQSWSWYYPHHYSPFISDVKNFCHLNFDFDLGKPFLPFQQLVSIMPAASKELVPSAYRGLMVNDDSPLKEYFPDDFETDLNGKTQDWEAVVLIKYIEENILLDSMKKYDNMLTESEKQRNQHGPHLVYEYNSKSLGTYKSPTPLNKWFPSIVNSHARCYELSNDTFRIKPQTIIKGRLPNTKDSLHFPGFPSLRYLNHSPLLTLQGCTIFQQASRGYNMIIHIEETPDDLATQSSLIGKVVHIGYPHLRQARVTKVMNEGFVVSVDGKKKTSEIEAHEFAKKVDSLEREQKMRWGINTGESGKLLVYCKPLIGRKFIYQGEDQVIIEKQWSDQDIAVLHNTVVSNLIEHEFEVATVKSVKEVFAIDKTVFLLNSNEYGMQGVVKGHGKHGQLIVESLYREEPDFNDIRKKEPELRKTDYLPSFRLAKELNLESHLVARLTGCVQVQINSVQADSSQIINIGLNLKFNKKNEEVVGFSKRIKTKDGRTEWRFSRETAEYLKELLVKYGDFYAQVRKCFEMDKIPLEKCFSGDEYHEAITRVKELSKWIKEQPFSKAPRQKSGGIVFDEGVVEAIQDHVVKHNKSPLNSITVKISAKDVYLPGSHVGLFPPDSKTFYCMYDRVVNVRQDITIPLGLKGTVIGIHRSDDENVDDREATYEVLFDEEFSTGCESRGAKGNRVGILSNVSMINITHGKRMKEEEQATKQLVKQGHGAWNSPNETKKVVIMRRKPHQQSPPTLPPPVDALDEVVQNEQQWFDPQWSEEKSAGQKKKKPSSPKKESKPVNIINELFNKIEGVEAKRGRNKEVIQQDLPSTSSPQSNTASGHYSNGAFTISVNDLFSGMHIQPQNAPATATKLPQVQRPPYPQPYQKELPPGYSKLTSASHRKLNWQQAQLQLKGHHSHFKPLPNHSGPKLGRKRGEHKQQVFHQNQGFRHEKPSTPAVRHKSSNARGNLPANRTNNHEFVPLQVMLAQASKTKSKEPQSPGPRTEDKPQPCQTTNPVVEKPQRSPPARPSEDVSPINGENSKPVKKTTGRRMGANFGQKQ